MIKKLSQHVADLIAAGEVVERPSSVIKELVENSIDGGATAITVEIKKGGMVYIRVTDNGCGIEAEDAETAFLRHATSKISDENDLAAIGTLGFRGEALAAIASVSKIDMFTKRQGAQEGVSMSLEAGVVTDKSPAGCHEGTTMIVRDLFYNTPARQKFMKRDSAEASGCASIVCKLALAHPEISFKFIKDEAEQLTAPGDGKLLSAIYSVFGRETALGMLEASGTWERVRAEGFVSVPTVTRGNRNYQHFFVNGRYVKSKLLQAAVEQAYRNRIMSSRYPACVLHVTLPESEVDVNVHPTKTEVKFLYENMAFESVYHATLSALGVDKGRPDASFSKPKVQNPPQRVMDEFFKAMSSEEFKSAYSEKAANSEIIKPAYNRPLTFANAETGGHEQLNDSAALPYKLDENTVAGRGIPDAPEPPVVADAPITPESPGIFNASTTIPTSIWRVVGEVMHTYIVVNEEPDSMVLIDKHAAHERIIFERLKAEGTAIMSQSLLVPIVFEPAPSEKDILLENEALLQEFGFEISDFGGNSIAVRRVPADINAADAESALQEMAESLLSGKSLDPKSVRDEMLHTVACKAAIKAGSKTGTEEFKELARQVMTNLDIKYCPHGRPVAITITRKELDKLFKRS